MFVYNRSKIQLLLKPYNKGRAFFVENIGKMLFFPFLRVFLCRMNDNNRAHFVVLGAEKMILCK